MELKMESEFESACIEGNVSKAKDLFLRFPYAVGGGGAVFLSRLISSIEDLPIGVEVITDKSSTVEASTDEEDNGQEHEKEKASREKEEVKRRGRPSSFKNVRSCLRRATVQTLKIAIKAVYSAKSSSVSELLLLLVRVLESPRLHYDVNYDIARALIKYGNLSSDDISGLVVVTTESKSTKEATEVADHSVATSKTPLHAAVTSGCFELCWLLVERFGAVKSLHVKDIPNGRTPAQLAALLEHIEISDWLLEQQDAER
jgi:hypothetical protein